MNTNFINEVFKKEFNKEVLEIREIVGRGSVNKVFSVLTNDYQKYIIRIRNNNFAFKEYEKEKWCIEKSSIIGIKGPKVLAIGILDNISYMIESFIVGINGDDLKGQSNNIWYKIGEFSAKIHSISAKGFGLEFNEKNREFFNNFTPTWENHINYNIASLTAGDYLIKLNVYEINAQQYIKDIFKILLKRDLKFGLCHGDLSPRNVIVDKEEVFLIDWGCALVHIIPHYDILTLIKSNIIENIPSDEQIKCFLKGYGISEIQYDDMKNDIYSILLLDSFDKLRWAIDKNPESIEEFAKYAKNVLNKLK